MPAHHSHSKSCCRSGFTQCFLFAVVLVAFTILSQQSMISTLLPGTGTAGPSNVAKDIAHLRSRMDALEVQERGNAALEIQSKDNIHDKDSAGTQGSTFARDAKAIAELRKDLQELQNRIGSMEASVTPAQSSKKIDDAAARAPLTPNQYVVPCLTQLGDFSSKKAMVDAGWKLDVSNAEYGAQFFGWKSGEETGSVQVNLNGSGRLLLGLMNPFPDRTKDSEAIIRLNGDAVLRVNTGEDRKICLRYKPCDVISVSEIYAQITLRTAKAVCTHGLQAEVKCSTGDTVRWGGRLCDLSDAVTGQIGQILNETRAVFVAKGGDKTLPRTIVNADELYADTRVVTEVSVYEAALGLVPTPHCTRFPFRRSRVGLLTIADHQFQRSYELQIQSVRCFAAWRRYDHWVLDNSDFPACKQFESVFFFQKHCIISEFLKTQSEDYIGVVMDADVTALVLERGVEEWLQQGGDLIFYTRGDEIAAGNYIVRNTAWTRHFLLTWAKFITRQPSGFSSADNGAIHLLVVEALKLKGAERCAKMYSELKALIDNMNPYFDFVKCTRAVLGPLKTWKTTGAADGKGGGSITVLPEPRNFVVDPGSGTPTDLAGPVMMHNLKQRRQVEEKYRNLDTCELKSSPRPNKKC